MCSAKRVDEGWRTFKPPRARPFLKYPFGHSGLSVIALQASFKALEKEQSKQKNYKNNLQIGLSLFKEKNIKNKSHLKNVRY